MRGGIAAPAGVELGVERDPEISDLIRRLQSLTPQQTRVLGMLAEGLLNKQIAYELGVSEATIKAHVSAVLQKLGVDSRTQAVILLSRIGSDPLHAGRLKRLFRSCRRHAPQPRHHRAQHRRLHRLVEHRHVDAVRRAARTSFERSAVISTAGSVVALARRAARAMTSRPVSPSR